MPETPIDITEAFGLDVPWTAEDAAALRHFLGTTTGKRFLGQFIFKRPSATEKSDLTKRAIQSGVVEGYEEAAYRIGALANSEKSVAKPAAPAQKPA